MDSSITRLAFVLFVAATIIPVDAAKDYNTDSIGKYSHCSDESNTICFDSFVWCSSEKDGCQFPDYTYAYFNRDQPTNPALVLWDHDYNVTWQNNDDSYPTLITWTFPAVSDSQESNTWSKNVSAGESSYIANFKNMATEFSEDNSDVTSLEIKAVVSEFTNVFRLSQPETDTKTREAQRDISDQFSIFHNLVVQYLETQEDIAKEDNLKTWRLGVGIGVGLGVPIAIAAAFVAGCVFGKRRRPASSKETTG